MKINARKQRNIQRIAQRFIDMCYGMLDRPTSKKPIFSYWLNKNEVVVVEYCASSKKWEVAILGHGSRTRIEI